MSDRAIIDAIQKIAGVQTVDTVYMFAGAVVSVNEGARTCTVSNTSGRATVNIENVQLMASVDDGFLLIPTIDSTVIVSYSTHNAPFITLFSSIDKVLIIVGNTQIKITDGLVQFNDGSLGGLVKITQLTNKLNNLENLVNGLAAKYNSHTHVLALSAGTGTAAATATQQTTVLTPTQQAEIEDTTIKH